MEYPESLRVWLILCGLLILLPAGTVKATDEGTRLYGEGMALYKEARSKEDLQQAEERLAAALKIFEAGRLDKGIGDAANVLGVICANTSRPDKAVEYWE